MAQGGPSPYGKLPGPSPHFPRGCAHSASISLNVAHPIHPAPIAATSVPEPQPQVECGAIIDPFYRFPSKLKMAGPYA